MKGPRVLVVAADEIAGEGMSKVLRKAGFRSLAARDGAEALGRMTGKPGPAVIVADVVMPKMGGLTLAERAREANPNVRVVLMSGYEEESLAGALPKQGVTWVRKPLTPDELLFAVRVALATAPVSAD